MNADLDGEDSRWLAVPQARRHASTDPPLWI